jgi:hypothetical protein
LPTRIVGVGVVTCSLLTGETGMGGETAGFGWISKPAVAMAPVLAPSCAHARQ